MEVDMKYTSDFREKIIIKLSKILYKADIYIVKGNKTDFDYSVFDKKTNEKIFSIIRDSALIEDIICVKDEKIFCPAGSKSFDTLLLDIIKTYEAQNYQDNLSIHQHQSLIYRFLARFYFDCEQKGVM